MTDMLCSLSKLPSLSSAIERVRIHDISIRRPNPWERTIIHEFIRQDFSRGWADEAMVAFAHQPITCFVAWQEKEPVGFACYECTRKGYFGPIGVHAKVRSQGVGTALLLASMHGLQDLGYGYAIIGQVNSVAFYQRVLGAVTIEIDGGRGIYGLKEDPRFLV